VNWSRSPTLFDLSGGGWWYFPSFLVLDGQACRQTSELELPWYCNLLVLSSTYQVP
jgi:hypothetical protein